MKLNSKLAGAALALATCFGSAQAAIVADLGVDPLASSTYTVNHAPGSFSDIFTFSLSTASDAVAASVGLTLSNLLNLSFSSFGLFSDPTGTGSGGSLLTSGTIDPSLKEANISAIGLTSGNYYVKLNGDALGALGGVYVFAANTEASGNAPIPEPETYAMMLAGLGAMGWIARRRAAAQKAANDRAFAAT